MHYICIKKNHVFISVSSEKFMYSFIQTRIFKKKQVQNFIMCFVKKKRRKKTKEGKCGDVVSHLFMDH